MIELDGLINDKSRSQTLSKYFMFFLLIECELKQNIERFSSNQFRVGWIMVINWIPRLTSVEHETWNIRYVLQCVVVFDLARTAYTAQLVEWILVFPPVPMRAPYDSEKKCWYAILYLCLSKNKNMIHWKLHGTTLVLCALRAYFIYIIIYTNTFINNYQAHWTW